MATIMQRQIRTQAIYIFKERDRLTEKDRKIARKEELNAIREDCCCCVVAGITLLRMPNKKFHPNRLCSVCGLLSPSVAQSGARLSPDPEVTGLLIGC